MRINRHCLRKEFTLVELLVVIAIIGILASFLLPALTSSLSAARSSACSNNLKQYGMYIQTYTNQNNGYLPRAFYLIPGDAVVLAKTLHQTVLPELYLKLGTNSSDGNGNTKSGTNTGYSFFKCPENDIQAWGAYGTGSTCTSYAANASALGQSTTFWRETQLVRPSRLVFLGEKNSYNLEPYKTNLPSDNNLQYRHGKMISNLGYADGHVKGHAPIIPYQGSYKGTVNGQPRYANDGMWFTYGTNFTE